MNIYPSHPVRQADLTYKAEWAPAGLFRWVGPRSQKIMCTVCGDRGYPCFFGPRRSQMTGQMIGASWSWKHVQGHNMTCIYCTAKLAGYRSWAAHEREHRKRGDRKPPLDFVRVS